MIDNNIHQVEKRIKQINSSVTYFLNLFPVVKEIFDPFNGNFSLQVNSYSTFLSLQLRNNKGLSAEYVCALVAEFELSLEERYGEQLKYDENGVNFDLNVYGDSGYIQHRAWMFLKDDKPSISIEIEFYPEDVCIFREVPLEGEELEEALEAERQRRPEYTKKILDCG